MSYSYIVFQQFNNSVESMCCEPEKNQHPTAGFEIQHNNSIALEQQHNLSHIMCPTISTSLHQMQPNNDACTQLLSSDWHVTQHWLLGDTLKQPTCATFNSTNTEHNAFHNSNEMVTLTQSVQQVHIPTSWKHWILWCNSGKLCPAGWIQLQFHCLLNKNKTILKNVLFTYIYLCFT